MTTNTSTAPKTVTASVGTHGTNVSITLFYYFIFKNNRCLISNQGGVQQDINTEQISLSTKIFLFSHRGFSDLI